MSKIKLVEGYSSGHANRKTYSLRQIYVNPSQVACLREDEVIKGLLSEGRLIDGLDPKQSFAKITLNNGEDITVIGELEDIYQKLYTATREVVRG